MDIWTEIQEEIALLPVGHFDLDVTEPTITVNGEAFTVEDPEGLLEAIKDLSDHIDVDDLLNVLDDFNVAT